MNLFRKESSTDARSAGVLHGIAAMCYILLVVGLISLFPEGPDPEPQILIPIAMLTLFTASVAVMAVLVFARPVLWYLDGRKKEAVTMLVSTIATLLVSAVVWFALLLA